MTDDRYEITTVRGVRMDRWEAQRLNLLLDRFPRLIITQGPWSNAEASGGTHKGAGVVDLYLNGENWRDVLEYAFQIGWYGWHRATVAGLWKEHLHLALRGHPGRAQSLKNQETSWRNKRNGLQGNGPDAFTWRPANYREPAPYSKPAKPTTLRVATYNLPASDKLPDAPGRILAAVSLLADQKLHVIGWNELEPIKGPGQASGFAAQLDAALSKNWRLIKPTRGWNENYISYRGDVLTLVAQYADSILEAPTGGRHVTRAVLKYKTGFVFAVGQTHLVNGTSKANVRDRRAQALDVVTSMLAVSAKHGNCPVIIQGDFNTDELLAAFKGWKRTREAADNSATRNESTFTPYDRDKPSTGGPIDQQYVTQGFYVVAYNVIRRTVKGLYRKPRPSDHDPVVTEIRSN